MKQKLILKSTSNFESHLKSDLCVHIELFVAIFLLNINKNKHQLKQKMKQKLILKSTSNFESHLKSDLYVHIELLVVISLLYVKKN